MKIYVASSWRNLLQPSIVMALRRCGHEVYDFKHPAPGDNGFAWSSIDPDWQNWTPEQYRESLKHPIAARGYALDKNALDECEAAVLVLPSGRSASWEFGYAMGQKKPGYVVMFDKFEPELMYLEAKLLTAMNELFDVFGEPTP
jgi:nucleoside 2-deoxyribosyltransferase